MDSKTQSVQPTKTSMVAVGDLIKSSWELYKKHAKNLALLALIVLAPSILSSLLMIIISDQNVIATTSILLSLVSIVTSIWGSAATIIYIKETPKDINEPLKKAWGFFWSYLWLAILVGIVTIIGYILLIIPGIILTVFYTFAMYVLICENIHGWAAAKKSMDLVKNYWWANFGRLIVMFIVIYLPMMIITGIVTAIYPPATNLATVLLSLVAMPFAVLYSFKMYQNLKEIKKI